MDVIIYDYWYCVGCRKTSRVAAWLSRRVLLKTDIGILWLTLTRRVLCWAAAISAICTRNDTTLHGNSEFVYCLLITDYVGTVNKLV